MTNYGGYQHGYGAPALTPPPTPEPKAERVAPVGQVLISAALLLVGIALFYVHSRVAMEPRFYERSIRQHNWMLLAITVPLPLYYVVVVALRARRGRRLAAVTIAFLTAVSDLALFGASVVLFRDAADRGNWLEVPGAVLVLVGYVAAWGVARRRHGLWTTGLFAAVVCGCVLQVVYALTGWADPFDIYASRFKSFDLWFPFIGAFVLSCLICWALDAISARSRRAPTPQFPGR